MNMHASAAVSFCALRRKGNYAEAAKKLRRPSTQFLFIAALAILSNPWSRNCGMRAWMDPHLRHERNASMVLWIINQWRSKARTS